MDMNKLREELLQHTHKSVAAWKKLPELLESGWLVKSSGSWYHIKDHRAVNAMAGLIKGFRGDKTGKVTHMQLSKPNKRMIDLAERNP